MSNEKKLIEGFMVFENDDERDAHAEWNSKTKSPGNFEEFEDYYHERKKKQTVDLSKAVRAMNQLSQIAPASYSQSMTPMPTLPSYTVNIPQYGGNGPQRTTAATLKNKVLANTNLVVCDGVIYCYNGKCYQALSESRIKQLILAICENELNEKGRFELVLGAMNFILSEPRIQLTENILNRRIVTYLNGNLDVETGDFTVHSPGVFTTHTLQCHYIPHNESAETPVFDALLHRISGGDMGIEQRIWEMFGYCLVPDMRAKKGFVFQGRKHSGKTLLCDFLASFFPPHVVSALPAHDFSAHFSLSELEGKALCISGDMSAEPLNNRTVGNIKQLSGNDLISAAKKYKDNRQFRYGGKLILVSNHQILTQRYDDAFWDRLVAIPFPYTVPPEEQDGNLLERLKPERDLIASKAIAAYWQLRSRAYRFSGLYEINSGSFLVEDFNPLDVDMQPVIRNFLLGHFEAASYDTGLFMSDIHEMFVSMVAPIPLTRFGSLFGNMAIGLFNARRTKKHRTSKETSTSYLEGITYKHTEVPHASV